MAVSKSKKRASRGPLRRRKTSKAGTLRNQAEWFRILNLLSRTINLASTDLAGILKNLIQGLIREMGVDAVAVWVAEESGFMKIEASAGLSDQYVRFFNRTDRIPVGKGLVGSIMKSRKTISFERLEEYRRIGVSRWNQMLEEEGISATLAAPMFVGKKIVGTFNIYYKKPHRFSNGERQFIEILANQIAITIENILNYRVIERDKDEMRLHIEKLLDLQHAVHVINLTIYESLDRAAEYIATYVSEKFRGQAVCIFQADEKLGLKLAASFGVSEHYRTRFYERSKAGTTLIDRAYREGAIQTSPRVLTDERVDKHWSTFLSTEGLVATAALPLIVHERVIGVLAIHYAERHVFSEDETSVLTTLAQFIGASLENIRNIQSLIAEQEKIKAIVYSLHDGLIVYDPEGVIIEVNPRAEELLLVKRASVVGKHPRELKGRTTILETIVKVSTLLIGDFESKEIDIFDPVNISLRVSQAPLRDVENRKIGVLRVLNDITEARAIEKMKLSFLTTASHQMRTPLTGIKWGLSTLLKSAGNLTQEQQTLAEKIFESNENIIRLINDLLDVSRIEEGRFEYVFAKRDIQPILERITRDFEETAQNSGIRLAFHRPSVPVPPAMIDENRIDIAFRNIVDNALKYTPRGGAVDISLNAGDHSLVIIIRDTGVGIPKEDQKFLFNKFFRGKNAVIRQTEGSGLGLYISKNIIESHNGKIVVDSTENSGTAFIVQLPTGEEAMLSLRPKA